MVTAPPLFSCVFLSPAVSPSDSFITLSIAVVFVYFSLFSFVFDFPQFHLTHLRNFPETEMCFVREHLQFAIIEKRDDCYFVMEIQIFLCLSEFTSGNVLFACVLNLINLNPQLIHLFAQRTSKTNYKYFKSHSNMKYFNFMLHFMFILFYILILPLSKHLQLVFFY